MTNDFSLDLGPDALADIPEPTQVAGIEDAFDHPVGFKLGIVGVGQAGGRIAFTFYEQGYRRVCAVNTASADLAELDVLSDKQKLLVGDQQGAGKDPSAAAKMIADSGEDLYDLFTRSFGDDVDYILVCFSAAGGTGAGAYPAVVKAAKRYMREKKRPNKVGCVIALPKDSEGQRGARNVLLSMDHLTKLNVSPIIFIDNERFKVMYGDRIAASKEKQLSNVSTVKVLHTFNRLAGTESEDVGGTTFDPADFARVLDSGVVAFASAALKNWQDPTEITSAIRDKLKNNVLASVDLTQGTVAGLLYVVSGEAWDGDNPVTISHLDSGTEMMNRLLTADNAAVFPGVYPAAGPAQLSILSMVGGLPLPQKRLQSLFERSGLEKDKVAAHLLG